MEFKEFLEYAMENVKVRDYIAFLPFCRGRIFIYIQVLLHLSLTTITAPTCLDKCENIINAQIFKFCLHMRFDTLLQVLPVRRIKNRLCTLFKSQSGDGSDRRFLFETDFSLFCLFVHGFGSHGVVIVDVKLAEVDSLSVRHELLVVKLCGTDNGKSAF